MIQRCVYTARLFLTPVDDMTAIVYAPLEAPLWPLMNKFYRAHQSSMKASKACNGFASYCTRLFDLEHQNVIRNVLVFSFLKYSQ